MGYQEKCTHSSFKRYCKAIELRNDPALIEAYRKVHAPGAVWKDIKQGIREVGIIHMEIFLLENRLFMIMDTVPEFNHDQAMAELASKPRQQEWETYVSRFQKTTPDASASEKWQLMERIFKLE